CYFSTINCDDFSLDKSRKHELHPGLNDLFKDANLSYVFCDEDPFGNRLLNVVLRPNLPKYQDYLKEKEKREEEVLLEEKKIVTEENIENPDSDFLENIKHLDIILAKKNPTAFEMEMIRVLVNRHE